MRSLASLLAAVYADPASDTPRAVYADALQEAGDPRGELIALQLAGENKKSAKLLAKHRDAWLGSLRPYVDHPIDDEFARGFPARLALATDIKQLPRDPAWATVVEVFDGMPLGSPLTSLRHAWEQDLGVLAKLAKLAPAEMPPLEVLACVDVASSAAALRAARKALATLRIPTLRDLRLGVYAWSETATLAPGDLPMLLAIGPLARLTVSAPLATLDGWIAAAPPQLELLALAIEGGGLVDWWPNQRRISADQIGTASGLDALASVVERLPPGAFGILHVKSVPKGAWTVAVRRRMAAALALHASGASWNLAGYRPA